MKLAAVAEAVMGAQEYVVPDDPRTLMADFYALDLLRHGAGTPPGHRQERLEYELEQAEQTLCPALRERVLELLGYSVACELRHIFDTVATDQDIYDVAVEHLPEKLVDVLWRSVRLGGRPDPQEVMPYLTQIVSAGLKLFPDGDDWRWHRNYGGELWQSACKLWLALYRARRPAEIRMALDRIYQAQHNSGSILNKNQGYEGEWLPLLLDMKFRANEPEELVPLASPYLRKLAGYVLRGKFGRSWDQQRWGERKQDLYEKVMWPVWRALERFRDDLAEVGDVNAGCVYFRTNSGRLGSVSFYRFSERDSSYFDLHIKGPDRSTRQRFYLSDRVAGELVQAISRFTGLRPS